MRRFVPFLVVGSTFAWGACVTETDDDGADAARPASPEETSTGRDQTALMPEPEANGDTIDIQQGTFRGLLVGGHEVRAFTPCGESDALWVRDPEGELWSLYEELASDPYQPLYAELRGELGPPPEDGFGADYSGLLTVERWLHLAVDTVGCVRKSEGELAAPGMDGLEFRAFGNEPFWKAEIGAGGIVFQEMGSDERSFPYEAPQVLSGGWTYSFRAEVAERPGILIRIIQTDCPDTMADAVYGFSAQVTLDGRTFSGCARQGSAEAGY
jgi:putative lipoprotein